MAQNSPRAAQDDPKTAPGPPKTTSRRQDCRKAFPKAASPKPPLTPELPNMLPRGFPQPPQRLPDSVFRGAAVLSALRAQFL